MIAGWDRTITVLLLGVAALLATASVAGRLLRTRVTTEVGRRGVENLVSRVRAWWVMVALFAGAIFFGLTGTLILFGFVSFMALREMLTLSPTRRSDHHTLFWAFFVMVPIQYYLISINWYGFFVLFIPIYCFLFIAIRGTLSGDSVNYLERTSKIQWAVVICVYFVSHAPALLTLNIPGYAHQSWKLLVFLVVVAQMSDVLQYIWGKMLGRHKIAPHISPNKTWEGFVGGVLTATALGTLLSEITPFTPLMAAKMAFTIAILGFFGGIVMSAVKRDAGVKDYGQLIEGHGGMMDRIDSLTFAAPVFFHLVRWYFVAPP